MVTEPIVFECECGQSVRAPERLAGCDFSCPKCGRSGRVPSPWRLPSTDSAGDVRQQISAHRERQRDRRKRLILISVASGGVVLGLVLLWLLRDVAAFAVQLAAGLALAVGPFVFVFWMPRYSGWIFAGAAMFVLGTVSAISSESDASRLTAVVMAGLGALIYLGARVAAAVDALRPIDAIADLGEARAPAEPAVAAAGSGIDGFSGAADGRARRRAT